MKQISFPLPINLRFTKRKGKGSRKNQRAIFEYRSWRRLFTQPYSCEKSPVWLTSLRFSFKNNPLRKKP